MELKHTRLGVSSFILSLSCLLGLIVFFLFINFKPELINSDGFQLILGFGIAAIGVLGVVSLVLSIAGFLQRKCKKIYTYLGFLLSLVIIFTMYKIIQIGLAGVDSESKYRQNNTVKNQSRIPVRSNVELYEERARKERLATIERDKQEKIDKINRERQAKIEKDQLDLRNTQERNEKLFNAKVDNIITPGVIRELVTSNSGRYLIFLLKDAESSIQVFDTEREKFTTKLVLPSSRVHIAANSEHVFVANNNDNSLTKLAIEDLEELSKMVLLSDGIITAITAARDSHTAPIGIIAGEKFRFYDSTTLREIKTNWFSEKYNRELPSGLERRVRVGSKLRASPNGKFFTFWETEVSPAGVNLISIEKAGSELNAVLNNVHTTAGYLSPVNNGSIYTNFNGIYNQDLKVISSEAYKNNHLIPVQGSDTFINIVRSREKTNGAVIDRKSQVVLADLGELYMMHNTDHTYSFHKEDINPDQRYFWYPKQKKLIVIPYINNEIVSIKYN